MNYRYPLQKLFSILFLFLALSTLHAQQTNIKTHGRYITGPCGDTVLLHGVNYAPYNWGYDNTQLHLSEIAQTGANAVRMPWYAYSSAPYYTAQWLDTAIRTCIDHRMIPIIELHNLTCDGNTADIDTLAYWYVRPDIMAVINKYQSSLIINFANELGYVSWANNSATAQQTYVSSYQTAISTLRNAGIKVPLMIDAPDCGMSLDVLNGIAAGIISSDPDHNIIFSTHAYWTAYANNDSATMDQIITTALASDYPFVIGELANYQDNTDNNGNTQYCHWTLDYQALLHICMRHNVGWLVWSWDQDLCAARQMSTDGSYAHLSAFGSDVVLNSGYGLRQVGHPMRYFVNNNSCATAGISDVDATVPAIIIASGSGASVRSLASTPLMVEVYDLVGRSVLRTTLEPGQQLSLPTIGPGTLQIGYGTQQKVRRFVSQ
ncbi:MAG: cellulase family glycosylhydrolase [Bacteroidetes bacterium]|nr:cellulase family glycosylhydrolase [Bacteroidota bacterium]